MIIKTVKYLIAGLVLILELLFCLSQGVFLHGPVFDVSYRHEQRVPAFWDNYLHPSPAAKARLDDELARMNRHLVLRTLFTVAVFAGIDWIGFRYLWNYGRKKTIA